MPWGFLRRKREDDGEALVRQYTETEEELGAVEARVRSRPRRVRSAAWRVYGVGTLVYVAMLASAYAFPPEGEVEVAQIVGFAVFWPIVVHAVVRVVRWYHGFRKRREEARCKTLRARLEGLKEKLSEEREALLKATQLATLSKIEKVLTPAPKRAAEAEGKKTEKRASGATGGGASASGSSTAAGKKNNPFMPRKGQQPQGNASVNGKLVPGGTAQTPVRRRKGPGGGDGGNGMPPPQTPQQTPQHGARPMPMPMRTPRTTVDKVVEWMIGEGPSSKYALVCKACFQHNGLVAREDFERIKWKCQYCGTLHSRTAAPSSAPAPATEAAAKSAPAEAEKPPKPSADSVDKPHAD